MMYALRRALPGLLGLLIVLIGVSHVHAQTTGGLVNPVSGISSIQQLIAAFLKAVVEISLPILTVFIVYSGFLFITARGNEAKLTTAKNNFLYVIVGALLILGAWELANIIGGTVGQITNGSG